MSSLHKATHEMFTPIKKSDSKHSIGNSSNSSGLVSDFDPIKDVDKINDRFKSISTTSKGYLFNIISFIFILYFTLLNLIYFNAF